VTADATLNADALDHVDSVVARGVTINPRTTASATTNLVSNTNADPHREVPATRSIPDSPEPRCASKPGMVA
jgi:hypothetical protein